MIDSLLLAATRISTFEHQRGLTGALARPGGGDPTELANANDNLSRALVPTPPTERASGGFIAEGYDAALDELRSTGGEGRRAIAGGSCPLLRAGLRRGHLGHRDEPLDFVALQQPVDQQRAEIEAEQAVIRFVGDVRGIGGGGGGFGGGLAEGWAEGQDLTQARTALLLNASSLAAFGLLWVGKFLIINHLLFHHKATEVVEPRQVITRRRPDPLADVWETEILPMLRAAPALRRAARPIGTTPASPAGTGPRSER